MRECAEKKMYLLSDLLVLVFMCWLTNLVVVYARDEIGGLVDELVVNTKRLIRATSREVNKWRTKI